MLVVITDRKARNVARSERRLKRGGGRIVDAAVSPPGEGSSLGNPLDRIEDHEPTPAFAAQMAEECRRLLHSLNDPELRAIALWKMEGFSIDEIAGKLDCVPRTVDRRLRLIREIWEKELRHA